MRVQLFNTALRYFPVVKKLFNKKDSLRVIYYHRVNNRLDDYYFNTGISPAIFREQLQALAKSFKIIPLSEALAMEQQEFNNHLCITFDDGFRECYDTIAPILKEQGLPATFFLTEKCIDNNDLLWRNKLLAIQNLAAHDNLKTLMPKFQEKYNIPLFLKLLQASNNWPMHLKDEMADFIWSEANIESKDAYLEKHKPYMTENQIKELLDTGFDIGGHSYSHPFCDKLGIEEIDEEIIRSSQRLAKRFATTCNTFSYPFGNRVSKENEKYIRENSDLKLLLGINDSLSNQQPSNNWERIGMERSYNKSMYAFYVSARISNLKKQKSRLN